MWIHGHELREFFGGKLAIQSRGGSEMGSEKVGGQHDRSLSVVSSLLIHLKLFEAKRGGEREISCCDAAEPLTKN